MGGDHSPVHEVDGAVMAARRWQIPIVLVGQPELLAQELAKHDTQGLDIRVEQASEVVGMHDSASDAVRKKKDSSIRVAFNLLKDGHVNAVVSTGNSGATMAAGMFVLKRIPGIDRPAIATVVPNLKDQTLVLDVGGNVDCFSCVAMGNARHKAWKGVSVLNRNHMLWAWMSLFMVGFADFYVWMVARGVFSDPALFTL